VSEVNIIISEKGSLILEGNSRRVGKLVKKLRESGLDFEVKPTYCG